MRLCLISEMPFAGFDFYAQEPFDNFDYGNGITSQSFETFRNKKVLNILSDKLSRLSKYNIKIVVIKPEDEKIFDVSDPDCITLAMVHDGYLGGQFERMTPWMALHQLGEAIDYWTEFDVVEFLYEYFGNVSGDPNRLFELLFKMRSARDKIQTANGSYDITAEVVTEYLWHGGRIRVNYINGVDPTVIDNFKSEVEDAIDKTLSSLVGKTITNWPG